jgi:hypothetical protein
MDGVWDFIIVPDGFISVCMVADIVVAGGDRRCTDHPIIIVPDIHLIIVRLIILGQDTDHLSPHLIIAEETTTSPSTIIFTEIIKV